MPVKKQLQISNLCVVCRTKKKQQGSLFCKVCVKKGAFIKIYAFSKSDEYKYGWVTEGTIKNYKRLPNR